MILNYIKGFFTLFLLIKVLLHFVPKNVFEKYISFFSGVILVIGLIYPLLQAFGQEQTFLKKMQYEQWEKELFEIAQDAAKLEETGEKWLEDYYGEKIEENSKIESIAIEAIKIENEIQAGGINE